MATAVKSVSKPATPAPKSTQVTVSKDFGIVEGTEVPDFIKKDTARGAENATMQDIAIPRLEIVQALSPAIKKGDPLFIPGAEQGQLLNSVSRENYGETVWVCPVYFIKQWLVWKDQKKGGGFGGAYDTKEEADTEAESRGEDWESIDTPQYVCLLRAGREIMVSMPKTKAKISRQWQALARMAEGDLFSRVYKLTTAMETNANNQSYYNYSVSVAGFPSKPLYEAAEALYARIKGGQRKVVMHTDDIVEGVASEI